MKSTTDPISPAFPRYWFSAKRDGWGWGIPTCWQGWVVLAVFVALLVAGVVMFPPAKRQLAFLVWTICCSAALVAVCWLKGEPPRWRWGDKGR